MRFTWLVFVVIGVVLAATVIGWWLARDAGKRADKKGWVANTGYLRSLPKYQALVRRTRLVFASVVVCFFLTVVAVAISAGAPVDRQVKHDKLSTRDIVLCLDASGSMIPYDGKIGEAFRQIVQHFSGERISLQLWDARSITKFPLTDDYDTLRNQLTEVANALDFDTSTATYHDPAYQRYARTFAGTTNRDIKASSLDGDGLASCAAAMGNQSVKDRPRILILATDNQVYDDYHLQIYSLQAAADFATQNNIKLITLFGVDAKNLDPGITQADIDAARTEIKNVTLEHNGLFYEVDDPNATSTIVNEVESTQVKEARENTQVRTTDVPEVWAVVLAGAVLVLLAGAVWRRA